MAVAATGTTANGLPYIGNADYRGYLNYLGQNGDTGAQSLLAVVGNDGNFGEGGGSPLNPATIAYNTQLYNNFTGTGGSGGSSTSTSSSTSPDQADTAAYWADQQNAINDQLNNLPAQQSTGENNILSSYNAAYQQLQNQKAQDNQTYNTTKQNDINNNVAAKDAINTAVQNNNTAVQRLLGSRGAGSSSAASIEAPLAVATQGNQQRTAENNTFGQNQQTLDQNWADTLNKYANSEGDLATQKSNKENALNQGIDQTKSGLLQQEATAALQAGQAKGQSYITAKAAEAPYQAQISQLLGQIDALGAAPTFTPQAVNYTPPTVASYTAPTTAAPVVNGNNTPGVDTSGAGAFYSLLNGQQKQNGTLAGATVVPATS